MNYVIGRKQQVSRPFAASNSTELIVDKSVIVELKSVEALRAVHKQLLLINFTTASLKDGISRVANDL